ncbi:MAG TPA: hypothetical protein VIV35_01740, partial [Chitinophagaceae bacterium]
EPGNVNKIIDRINQARAGTKEGFIFFNDIISAILRQGHQIKSNRNKHHNAGSTSLKSRQLLFAEYILEYNGSKIAMTTKLLHQLICHLNLKKIRQSWPHTLQHP